MVETLATNAVIARQNTDIPINPELYGLQDTVHQYAQTYMDSGYADNKIIWRPDELNTQIEAYFAHCQETGKASTITGICLFLDIDNGYFRQIVNGETEERLGMDIPALSSRLLKKARWRILEEAEQSVRSKGQNGGMIFWLKNVFGWVDKHEVISQSVSVNVNVDGGESPELVRALAAEYRARRLTGGNQGQLPAPVESKKE